MSIDLVAPQLAVRDGVLEPVAGPQADGVWTGWAESFEVAAVNKTADGWPAEHLFDATALLQRAWRLTDGDSIQDVKLATTAVRIVSAVAHPGSLEFVVEYMVPDTRNGRTIPESLHITLAQLPADPLIGRVSDDRIGYFETGFVQLGLDPVDGEWNKLVRMVNRWRLEPAEPACRTACLPVKPISYHIDPSVPTRWRAAAAAAVERWNGPFAAAGWRDAIRAVLPGDPDWPADYSAGDARYASISWGPYLSHGGALAIGPHLTDLRTGETLDADIVIDSGWLNIYLSRDAPAARPDTIATGAAPADGSAPPEAAYEPAMLRAHLLEAGLIGWGEPIPDEFISMALTSVLMHEVGHTLGLRHNFRGSAYFTMEQLGDTEWLNSTEVHGTAAGALSASIMDYVPLNLHADTTRRGIFYSLNPGKYDHRAIQYGYARLPGEVTGEQHPALVELAGRMSEEGLYFSTDEDMPGGYDPYVATYDQSAEPLEYFEDSLELITALWPTLMNRTAVPGKSWHEYASTVRTVLAKISTAGAQVAKYVGGRALLHQHAGDLDPTGKQVEPVNAVPLRTQLAAYALCMRTMTDSSWLPPEEAARFMGKLKTANFCTAE